jgi:hypothetical protein
VFLAERTTNHRRRHIKDVAGNVSNKDLILRRDGAKSGATYSDDRARKYAGCGWGDANYERVNNDVIWIRLKVESSFYVDETWQGLHKTPIDPQLSAAVASSLT